MIKPLATIKHIDEDYNRRVTLAHDTEQDRLVAQADGEDDWEDIYDGRLEGQSPIDVIEMMWGEAWCQYPVWDLTYIEEEKD